jgi:hypothetical protein
MLSGGVQEKKETEKTAVTKKHKKGKKREEKNFIFPESFVILYK